MKSKFIQLCLEAAPEPTIDELPPESSEGLGAAEAGPTETSDPVLTTEAETYLVGLIKKALMMDIDEESKKQVLNMGDEQGKVTAEVTKKTLEQLVHLMDIEDGPREIANMLDKV
tara:strand:- start:26205 stop:26549 length:345 start_codon:yes stop_codon:yes gene_type:complete